MSDGLDNGQLNVKLDLILKQLEMVGKTMMTKDLFDTWRDGNNQRLLRLEEDHKYWVQQSAAAHVELENVSKERHVEALREIADVESRLFYRIEEERKRADAFEHEQVLRKSSASRFVIGLIVTSFLSVSAIVATVVTAFIL